MSDRVVARAPGKLFLLGEYAVLDGCPAVVAAVDRGVEVTLSHRRPGSVVDVRISAGPYGALQFSASAPPAVDGPLRFACAAYLAAARRLPALTERALTIDIRSGLEVHGEGKIGLGSSAAVTVAVVAALAAACGIDLAAAHGRGDILTMALEAHRAAQGGAGSGADVAASVHGGISLFDPRCEGLPVSTALALPSDTQLLVGWSGTAASTVGLLQRYRCTPPERAPVRAAFVTAARACVERFVATLHTPILPLAAFDDYGRLLERLADDLELPLLTPRLQALLVIARAHGAAAKQSGAGGGDCGIALVRGATAAERIRAAWQQAGVVPLALGISPHGVIVERA